LKTHEINILIVLLAFMVLTVEARAVSALRNRAIAKGTVVEYCISSEKGSHGEKSVPLYKIVVKIEAVEAIKGYADFLEGREGEEIEFWSRSKLDPDLFGRKVKAHVEYRGDERGGRFFVQTLETVK
jgi:hypothetical protein